MGRLFPCTACKRHFFIAERVCPHCNAPDGAVPAGGVNAVGAGGTDNRMALVLAMLASVGAAACSEPPVAVYGPAPRNPDQRATTSSGDPGTTPTSTGTPTSPTSTGPTASAEPAPSSAPSAAPSSTPSGVASTKPQPTAPPTATVPPRPTAVALYGAMPRDPNRRSPTDPQ